MDTLHLERESVPDEIVVRSGNEIAVFTRRRGPSMRRYASPTRVLTPLAFIRAVERRFGNLVVDLAASPGDQVPWCSAYYTPQENSLIQDWTQGRPGNRWLNPPYDAIKPWVKKMSETSWHPQMRGLCLIPTSTGTKWWEQYVAPFAHEIRVGRLVFETLSPEGQRVPASVDKHGKPTAFPRELSLLVYGVGCNCATPRGEATYWRNWK